MRKLAQEVSKADKTLDLQDAIDLPSKPVKIENSQC